MLSRLPVTSLDEFGQINNLNLRQLNTAFERLYLNDLFLSALLEKRPTVYEHGREYKAGDCVWMNTEYYQEFIDFPDHAQHIRDAYNELAQLPEVGMVTAMYEGREESVLSLDYDVQDNVLSAAFEGGKRPIDYGKEEDLCKDLIKYSYMIGELTASAGLYQCTSANTGCVVGPAGILDELPKPWVEVYVNNDSIEYSYVSALVRTILSVHAMSYRAIDPASDKAHMQHTVLLSNDIPDLEFGGVKVAGIKPGYTPYRDSQGNVSSIEIVDLVSSNADASYASNDIPDRSMLKAGFDYYAYDETSGKYGRRPFVCQSRNVSIPDNIWFLHCEHEKANTEDIDSKYTAIDTFNVDLSALYEVTDNENGLTLSVRESDASLAYVVYQNDGETDLLDKMRMWSDGVVEWYGVAQKQEDWFHTRLPRVIGHTTLKLPSDDNILAVSSTYDTTVTGRDLAYFAQCRLDPAYMLSVLALEGVPAAKDFISWATSISIKKNFQLVVDLVGGGYPDGSGRPVSNYIDVEVNPSGTPTTMWYAAWPADEPAPDPIEFEKYSSGADLVNSLYEPPSEETPAPTYPGVYSVTISAVADSSDYNDASWTGELSVTGPFMDPLDEGTT